MITENMLKLCKELETIVETAYDEGVTLPDAEKYAAKFLSAQMSIAHVLRVADLDARMKKSGVKAIRAAVYLDLVQKSEKKPSDVYLEQFVNSSELVTTQQEGFDTAEVDRDFLQSYLRIAQEGHVYFRTVSRNQG